MVRQYISEAQEFCPCCHQPVLEIPLEYQCNYPGCKEVGEWEAWFGEGLIYKSFVCEEHLKLSQGYKTLVNELGDNHALIMKHLNE